MDELDTMMNANGGTMNPDAVEAPKARERKKKEPKELKAPKEPKAPKEKKPARDNIARINGMESIGDVRKALQIAIAKKAKAAGKPDTQAKYDIEIQAAKDKLAAMLDEAKTVADLIRMGEDPNKIITSYIKDIEDAFVKFSENYKVSKRVLKAVDDEIPASFYAQLPVELHEQLVTRHDKKDFRLRAACRNQNLMVAVGDGTLVYTDEKWYLKDGTALGVEKKASGEEAAASEEN